METKLLVIGMTACFALLSGCAHSEQAIPSMAATTASQAPPAASRTAAVAASGVGARIELEQGRRLPGLGSVWSAESWDARLAELPKSDQQFLKEKNQEYFDALRFSSPEEQRKLVAQDFPMPEEWAAARSLTDAELHRLARAGSVKGQIFYIDRVISEVGPILKERGFGDTPSDRVLYNKFNEASTMATLLLRSTRSPFVAYQNGLLFSIGTLGHSPETAAGSFMVAKELGDTRADFVSQGFYARHRNLDAQTVMASYSSIKSALGPKQ